jgi:flagellar basal body rod protein FlgC
MTKRLFILTLSIHAWGSMVSAADADPDLPQPFDPSELRAQMTRSPFNRIVAFSDTYQLTGVAYVAGKPIATLLNKETKQHLVVSDVPNAKGWQLTEASATSDPKQTEVKLLVGGEVMSLRYDIAAATEPSKTNHSASGISVQNGRRVVEAVDIHNLPESETLRKDKDGKEYVRGSIYLPPADREHYYNDMSREARDKYRQIIEDNRDKMFRYDPDQLAAFSKKVFDKVVADEKGAKR